MKKTNKTETD